MSVVATTLLFTVTPAAAHDGTLTTLLLDVRPSTTTPPHLLFDVTQVVGALDQLQPSSSTALQTTLPQVVYTIRGVDYTFRPSDFADGEMVLDMTPEGSSWKWAFPDQDKTSTRTNWVSPRVGWPIEWGTVAPGKSPVAYSLRYRTASLAWMTYPLMAEGTTKGNSSDLLQLSCEGVGPEGRWDKAKVSLFLDAEAGWTGGQIANYLLANAHDPDGNLVIAASKITFGTELGSPLNQPIDLDCVNAWGEAAAVLDQNCNCQLVAGAAADGTATVLALPKAPTGEVSKFTLSEGDFLAEGFEIDSISADHPTCIIVTSNSVDTTNSDGSVTTTVIELIYDTFAVPGAHFQQTASVFSALSSPGPLGDPFLQLKERRTTRTTTLDGCEIRVEELVEGYRNIETARYRVNAATTDLQFTKASGTMYVFDENAADLDSAPAYRWRYDRWTVLSWRVRQTGGLSDREPFNGRLPFWVNEAFHPGQREPTFTYTDTGGVARTLTLLHLPIRDFPVGRQLHEITFEGGWYNPPVALKLRANEGSTWESQNYINNTLLDSRLGGVQLSAEQFFADAQETGDDAFQGDAAQIQRLTYFNVVNHTTELTEQSALSYQRWLRFEILSREYTEGGITDNDEGGYITRETTGTQTWDRFPGSTYLYGDGFESRDQEAAPHVNRFARVVSYQATTTLGPTTVTEVERDIAGDLKPEFPKQTLGLQGYLPAMPVCNREQALRSTLVPLRIKICLAPDEDVFIGEEDEISVDYIETEAGLEDYATRLLRELTAIGVSGSIPVDARLVPLTAGTFNFPRRGYTSRRCWVETIAIPTTSTDRGLATVMQILLQVPVI